MVEFQGKGREQQVPGGGEALIALTRSRSAGRKGPRTGVICAQRKRANANRTHGVSCIPDILQVICAGAASFPDVVPFLLLLDAVDRISIVTPLM
ncbi:hypothetical protein AXG93_1054s1070 [Marchantia polymorpha subsp. ruderalis]|uniref:Uncharacterized protein n=1 Tax=Marchantia polymorpha subsp. ruderalis TaxID=1480154 RepID=A0A176WP01_MARPO|nr:hypothetical protein AXG93_1054s1070 [Marchantia polymorpha subsp. ruderalis]